MGDNVYLGPIEQRGAADAVKAAQCRLLDYADPEAYAPRISNARHYGYQDVNVESQHGPDPL